MIRTRQLQFLRPDEIVAEISRAPIVYWPLGLIEWHGPHLPVGVDSLNAQAVALRAADRSGGLVMPVAYFGTERERDEQTLDWLGIEPQQWVVGMDFSANTLPSMYAREDHFAIFVRENLRLMTKMGFKLIVVVSGHAATNQLATLERIAAEFNAAGAVRAIVVLPFVADEAGVLAVGHASRIETSVMMVLKPDTVRLENLPALPEPLRNRDWAIVDYKTFLGEPSAERTVSEADDPRFASAEAGREMLERAATQIVEKVSKELK
ncbi:MAG: creatininase family protein [Candidatus Promineifilaceae bacterium]